MGNSKENLITWVSFNNVVPVVFSLIAVGFSVALFWYNIKLEINDVKNEVKLTNQQLGQVVTLINTEHDEQIKQREEVGKIATRVTTLETVITMIKGGR